MTHHSFSTLFLFPQTQKHQLITVHFEYYLPEDFGKWQHPEYGSIRLIEILDAFTRKPLPSSDIRPIIQIRRFCWNYLENHQLIMKHHIKPLLV